MLHDIDVILDSQEIPTGQVIKKILQNVDGIAQFHAVLTSPCREYWRRRFLHALRTPLTFEQLERLRKQAGVEEYQRHLNKLVKYGLARPVLSEGEVTGYVRTDIGEAALNAVSELEREVGEERARVITEAPLGSDGIRLFLTIFGDNKEPDLTSREIIYTPLEIGQLIRSFARSVEGLSAVDMLDDAGLVSYLEDGGIHVNPRRSTAFYHYLKNLYHLLVAVEPSENGGTIPGQDR